MTEDKKRLLRLKEKIKRRRPNFVRQESWRYKRVKESWRRPKGIDNKMQEKRKGYPRKVGIGYRTPKAIRGLHPSGYELVYVTNPSNLDGVDPELEAIVISSTVGRRKKQAILDKADDLRIKVINKPAREVSGEIFEEAVLEDEYELLEDEDLEGFDEEFELEDDLDEDLDLDEDFDLDEDLDFDDDLGDE